MLKDSIASLLKNSWPMIVIFLIVIVAVRIAYLNSNNKKIALYEEVLNLGFIIYALLLFELLTSTESARYGLNLVPFTEIFRYKIDDTLFFYNVIGNILIFIPFGYFISRYIKAKKITPIFIISLVTSLTVELVQLQIGRAFDIDDIILNVTGALTGFLIYIGFSAIANHLPSMFRKDWFYNLICIIIILIIAIYIYHTKLFGVLA